MEQELDNIEKIEEKKSLLDEMGTIRYQLDENGYIDCVLWGCISGTCQKYTGAVPDGYETLAEWADNAIINAYYINEEGNLTLDVTRENELKIIIEQETLDNTPVVRKEMQEYADEIELKLKLKEQKVLWGTGNLNESLYMNDTQTINLDYAVSQQVNGIVLVWSRYTSGAAENSYFNFSYIPKWFVTKHRAAGVAVMLTGTPRDTNRIGIKYVYISDTSIKGYSYNDDQVSNTDSGINLHGNSYVLRYVIGV